jgi:tetratricopeptide (TPR) repeat protein
VLAAADRVLRVDGLLLMAPTDPLFLVARHTTLRAVAVGCFEHGAPSVHLGVRSITPPLSSPPRDIEFASSSLRNADRLQHARSLAETGELGPAREHLDRLLEVVPGDCEARLTRAYLHLAAKHYGAALQDFTALSENASTATIARYFRTICLAAMGDRRSTVAQLHRLEEDLARLPNDTPLDGRLSAAELLDAVRSDLRRLT